MNSEFLKIIAATPADRRDLFLATANRIGTPIQNVEKDFWVVFVLDLLFNGRAKDEMNLNKNRLAILDIISLGCFFLKYTYSWSNFLLHLALNDT